MTNSAMLL